MRLAITSNFFPLVTLSAVFGANVKSGIESLALPWPFLMIILLGVTLGAILTSAMIYNPPQAKGDWRVRR